MTIIPPINTLIYVAYLLKSINYQFILCLHIVRSLKNTYLYRYYYYQYQQQTVNNLYNSNPKMIDPLSLSNNIIPIYRQKDTNTIRNNSFQDNNINNKCGESLQIVQPKITIQDLLASLDSQVDGVRGQYDRLGYKIQGRNFGKKQYKCNNDHQQHHNYNHQQNHNYNHQQHHNYNHQQHPDQQILQQSLQNLQLEQTIQKLLEQLSQQTQISQQLMGRILCNNQLLGEQKSVYYSYEKEIRDLDIRIRQLGLLENNQRQQRKKQQEPRKINPKTASIKASTSTNTYIDNLHGYRLEYPTSTTNSPKTQTFPISTLSQLEQQLAILNNSTINPNNRSTTTIDSIDELFGQQTRGMCGQGDGTVRGGKLGYRKVVPAASWNPEQNEKENILFENKINLRRRLSEKQGAHQVKHSIGTFEIYQKQNKVQHKYSTPLKNQNIPKTQQNIKRKAIFTGQTTANSGKDQSSGRNRAPTMKIDVRAFK